MKEIVLRIGEYTLTAQSADDEPRIVDTQVAKGLGYGRDRDFRRLIRRLVDEGELPGIYSRAMVARQRTRSGEREFEIDEFHLTEREVIIATMAAKTPKAKAFRAAFADIIVRARRELRESSPPLEIHSEIVNGPKLGDYRIRKEGLRRDFAHAAREQHVTVQKIMGATRAYFGVSSPYQISLFMLDRVNAFLIALQRRQLLLAPAKQLHAAKTATADPKQLRLRLVER